MSDLSQSLLEERRRQFKRRVIQEFWMFLRSQGFPSGIDYPLIQKVAHQIDALSFQTEKRLQEGSMSFISMADHDDDVAIIKLVADKLGLREGVDWDWGVSLDNYHYETGIRNKELSRLVDLFHEASPISLMVLYSKLAQEVAQGRHVGDTELQEFFQTKWRERQEREHEMMEDLLSSFRSQLRDKKNRLMDGG